MQAIAGGIHPQNLYGEYQAPIFVPDVIQQPVSQLCVFVLLKQHLLA
jgi:hypothetical protein